MGSILILSRKSWGLFTLISIVALAGCADLSPFVPVPTITVPAPYTPEPTLAPTPTFTPGQILYEDHFVDPNSGWLVNDYDTGAYGYTDDAYSITAREESTMEWALGNQFFTDVKIDLDVFPARLPLENNNGFGLMCRAQQNGDGYAFRISADGYYAVHLINGDAFTPLVDWTQSEAILPGENTNHLTVICAGTRIEMLVNQISVFRGTDSTYSSGDVGLVATTYTTDPTEIRFDNLVVSQPSEGG